MDFRLNDEQQALKQAARELCTKEITSSVVREAFEGPDGDARDLYMKMAGLGWLGITVPERQGGLGMGPVEQAAVCEELGYHNAPGPYFSNACLAVPVLLALGADDLVAPVIDGSRRAAVGWDPEAVVDAHLADAILLVTDERAVWYEQPDCEIVPHDALDGTRRTAAVRPRGRGRDLGPAAAVRFRAESGAAGPVEAAAAMLCAEMVGGMQWVLDTTVAYAKDRRQFGRPIGSFQAVQHRLADMLLQTESSRSAAYYAAYACATGAPDAAFAVSVAKSYCSDAARFVSGEGIQLHGGIGYTWEHDLHLYFKRALLDAVLLGDAAFHRERVLALDPQPPGS